MISTLSIPLRGMYLQLSILCCLYMWRLMRHLALWPDAGDSRWSQQHTYISSWLIPGIPTSVLRGRLSPRSAATVGWGQQAATAGNTWGATLCWPVRWSRELLGHFMDTVGPICAIESSYWFMKTKINKTMWGYVENIKREDGGREVGRRKRYQSNKTYPDFVWRR